MKALFVGAGASYDCSMPLVYELSEELRSWLTPKKLISYNRSWKMHGRGWHEEVVYFLISLLENKNLHYENIIGALEVEVSRERNDVKRESYHSALAFLLQAVYGLLLERQVKNASFILSSLEDFSSIKILAENNKPLWIFSLNHDCIIEMLALKYNIPLKSGFNEKVVIPIKTSNGSIYNFPFDRLSRSSIKSNKYDFFQSGEFGINLIKLHGALDIFGQDDELNYLKISPIDNKPESIPYQLELINKINQDIITRDGVGCTNENLYEDENSEVQFLRKSLLSGVHKFTKQVHQIAPPEFLKLFHGYLNYADELICIGYSFGDSHIDKSIDDWLSFSSDRKLTIVNPGIKSCPERIRHLPLQIEMSSMGASDYFIKLGSKELTKDEELSRNFRKYLREKLHEKLKN